MIDRQEGCLAMHMQQKLVLGLFAVLAAIVTLIGGLVASQVSAGTPAIGVGGLTRFVGEQGTIEIKASGIVAPGLGGWTIDIVYDPAVVSVTGCDPAPNSLYCNEAYGADTVRIVGLSGTGLIGNSVLASITFQCDAQGDSALIINSDTLVFRDGTASDPQDIVATLGTGGILCEPTLGTPTATPVTPTATATPVEGAKPIGDVNCDWQTTGGVPTIADAQLIAQVVLQLIAEEDLDCSDNADVDGDGSITIADAQLIAQFVLGNISWPPL
jgi:hypothetical protein